MGLFNNDEPLIIGEPIEEPETIEEYEELENLPEPAYASSFGDDEDADFVDDGDGVFVDILEPVEI